MTWDPGKHPRIPRDTPGGGEFVHVGGWVAKLGDALAGRSPRRDLTHDDAVLADIAAQPTSLYGGDTLLGRIYHHQGFHAKPEVLTKDQMDQRVAAGWVELHRGFGAYQEHVEAFRTGDEHYPGLGSHANGTYTSRDRSFMDYALPEDGVPPEQWRTVARMALRPDARVVDLFGPEWHEWRSMHHDSVTSDFGRYAALRGFDAVRIPGGYAADKGPPPSPIALGADDHYNILNRGAVAVQEADR